MLDTEPDNVAMLGHIERRALASCAHRANRCGARLHMQIQKPFQRRPIDAAIDAHGSNQGDNTAGNHGLSPQHESRCAGLTTARAEESPPLSMPASG